MASALADTACRTNPSGRFLIVQAPTAIGKSIAPLFTLPKVTPEQQLDKVFPGSKTSARTTALDALSRIRASAPGLPLRVLELMACEQACIGERQQVDGFI